MKKSISFADEKCLHCCKIEYRSQAIFVHLIDSIKNFNEMIAST